MVTAPTLSDKHDDETEDRGDRSVSRNETAVVAPTECVTKLEAQDPGDVTIPARDGGARESLPGLNCSDGIPQNLGVPASEINGRVLGDYKLICLECEYSVWKPRQAATSADRPGRPAIHADFQ